MLPSLVIDTAYQCNNPCIFRWFRRLGFAYTSRMAPPEPTRKRSGSGPGGHAREIPDKLYFRIGEVARLCEVPAYVLRFWEGEFPQLKPNKGGTGQRLYRRRDVEMAMRIKTLLYDEGYTIPGARQAFKQELRTGREPQMGLDGVVEPGGSVDARHLVALKKELRELHAMLSKPASGKPTVQSIRPVKEPVVKAEKSSLVAFPKPKLKPVDELTDSLFDLLPPEA